MIINRALIMMMIGLIIVCHTCWRALYDFVKLNLALIMLKQSNLCILNWRLASSLPTRSLIMQNVIFLDTVSCYLYILQCLTTNEIPLIKFECVAFDVIVPLLSLVLRIIFIKSRKFQWGLLCIHGYCLISGEFYL